ncbi:MAG: hypothetical protein N4A71_15150 [Carboxylicivirga sp.]|jgi:hypothetical protein|nr:hypothetical protein [Carboxylicivirga sp.]
MKKIAILSMAMMLSIFFACQEDTFIEDTEMVYGPPAGLKYMDMVGAREGQRIISFPPAVETDGLIPSFEIVKVKDGSGNALSEEQMAFISIENPEVEILVSEETGEDVTAINYKNAGRITIADGNLLTIDNYSFDIKVSTQASEAAKVLETVFEDGFKLSVGPVLVNNLNYMPKTQNLLLDGSKETSKPSLGKKANTDVQFVLASHTDIFTINAETGIIKLKDGATVEAGTYYPQVNVINNISEEVVVFEGESFLTIIVSESPVEIPLKTFKFFYPTLEAENTMYGYRKIVTTAGAVADNKTWIQSGACPLAADDRPDAAAGAKSIFTNIVIGGESLPHESWVVMNSQNLEDYSFGYDLSAVFWMKNQYVEYMTDGRTPTDLEVYVSSDFASSVEDATWEKVNMKLKCEINNSGEIIDGTPYPGDQQGDNPDGLKSTGANADAKWVKCVLDLAPYKELSNFTIAFKFASYFDGSISGSTGRGGRYYISDVHMQATELPQE